MGGAILEEWVRHLQKMTIINIGANDGMDDCRDFVLANQKQISRVLIVEPSEEALAKCKENYAGIPNAEFHNLAIVSDDSNGAILYSPKNQPDSHHSSLIPNHTLLHGHKQIEGVAVRAMGIGTFLQRNNIEICDRLYIDTEGLDFYILMSLDFAKYRVGFIRYESHHFDGLGNKGQNHRFFNERLSRLGYTIKADGEWNETAEKKWNT
jgi:FkbM family methyltransferase